MSQGGYTNVDGAALAAEADGSQATSFKWKVGLAGGLGVAGAAVLGYLAVAHSGAPGGERAAATLRTAATQEPMVDADAKMNAASIGSSARVLERPADIPLMDSRTFGSGTACRDAGGQKGVEGTSFKVEAAAKSSDECKRACQRVGDDCTGIQYAGDAQECRVWLEPIGGTVPAEDVACFRRKEHEKTTRTKTTKTSTTETTTTEDQSARPTKCNSRFKAPARPKRADEHNGAALEDTCLEGEGPHHVFIIGDWGGITQGDGRLAAAPHLTHRWETNYQFIWPPDEQAQTLVRDQMRKRARESRPDYFLNVGDNFYWAGVEDRCGAKDITKMYSNGGSTVYKENKVNQFEHVYEKVYTGDGIDDVQWLGVMGNHDYGGWLFTHAWDQNIGYTWSRADYSTGRWMTPAMYYKAKVWYEDFAVDYYFLDTNIFDALDPKDPSPHNICSEMHNDDEPVTCAPVGPSGVWKCQDWFGKLWKEQQQWLDQVVPESTADWRIAVTHFPPCWGAPDWKRMAPKHEFDLVVAGHRHIQDMHAPGDNRSMVWHEDPNELYNDFLDPTVWVVSGGGGGVTSEREPRQDGEDDQYGFMDMTLEKEQITIEGISHGGQLRRKLVMEPAFPHHPLYDEKKAKKHAKEAKERAWAWWKANPDAKETVNHSAPAHDSVSQQLISSDRKGSKDDANSGEEGHAE